MTSQSRFKLPVAALILAGLGFAGISRGLSAQQRPLTADAPAASHRTRLILKDGSYQVVMSYRVVGNVVRYISAERGGAEEEIPLALVDIEATKRYEARRAAETSTGQEGQPPAIDPELLKEEAERASLTPEVAPDLHLPDDDNVLALDTFHGTEELAPLTQSQGELNHSTGHSIVRAPVNPMSSAHMITQIKGESSAVQMHVNDPVIYLRVGPATIAPTGSAPMTVDTHGASSQIKDAPDTSGTSRYVVVRVDVRVGARVVDSFKIGLLGSGRTQPDVIEMKTELLKGGHWMKLTPVESLAFGEYALMEVLSDRDVNIGVWDFGIHPVAPENRDVIKPQAKRPYSLEKRTSQN
jgi:hypothetical protein